MVINVYCHQWTPSSYDYDYVIDTANLTDEIAIVAKTTFNSSSNTVHKIQPNSGEVKLTDKFSAYGTAIVFKNKADSANLVLKTVDAAKPIDGLMELIRQEGAPKDDIVNLLKMISNNELVPSDIALPPRMIQRMFLSPTSIKLKVVKTSDSLMQ